MSLGDSIGSLFVKIGADLTEFESAMDQATEKIQAGATGWTSNVNEFAKAMKPAGEMLVGFGGAITGVMALSVNAAVEEHTALARLTQQLQNVGIAYDDVSAALAAQVDAAARMTNFTEEDQWNALSSMIMITGSYEAALKMLPTAMDLASAKGMDLTSAATLLGRVHEGNTSILTRYGIVVGEDATAEEALAAINAKVTGSAEAMANPLEILKNGLGEIGDKIGAILLPMLKMLVDALMPAIIWVQNFSAEHPLLAKVLVIVGAAIGVVALALGGLILLLPTIIAGVTALTAILPLLGAAFTVALGPIGLIILAIAAVAAAIYEIKTHWDTIITWLKEWGAFFLPLILGPFGLVALAIIKFWDPIKEAWGTITGWFESLWDGITGVFFAGVNAVIDTINIFIRAYNAIPILGDIGLLGHVGGGGGGEEGGTGGSTAEMDAALAEGRRQQAAADAAVAAQNAAAAAAHDAEAAASMAAAEANYASQYEALQYIGISGYQHGGIAVHPQVATLAEHEPEMITPVSMLSDLFSGGRRGGDTIIHVHVGGNIMAEQDLADTIRDELLRVRNRNVLVGLM